MIDRELAIRRARHRLAELERQLSLAEGITLRELVSTPRTAEIFALESSRLTSEISLSKMDLRVLGTD